MLPKLTLTSALLAAAFALSGCLQTPQETPDLGFAATLPVTRWDHRPEAEDWTRATLDALNTEGAVLLSSTPQDIETYCPGYEQAGPDQRAAFWVGMFSAIAKYESTWNPRASGAGGRYLGLLQISPQTARGAGCDANALFDGATNLSCAVRIAARRTPDSTAALARMTADWGPMHDSSKRAEMAAWTREQSYCQ